MRLALGSALITCTLTIWPTLTTSRGVLHEAVGQLADVDQAVLVHADIDEGAEARDVGDHAFERHAGLEVGDFADVLAPLGGDELVARIAARLAQLLADVAERVHADGFGGEAFELHLLDQFGLADQVVDGSAERFGDLLAPPGTTRDARP